MSLPRELGLLILAACGRRRLGEGAIAAVTFRLPRISTLALIAAFWLLSPGGTVLAAGATWLPVGGIGFDSSAGPYAAAGLSLGDSSFGRYRGGFAEVTLGGWDSARILDTGFHGNSSGWLNFKLGASRASFDGRDYYGAVLHCGFVAFGGKLRLYQGVTGRRLTLSVHLGF